MRYGIAALAMALHLLADAQAQPSEGTVTAKPSVSKKVDEFTGDTTYTVKKLWLQGDGDLGLHLFLVQNEKIKKFDAAARGVAGEILGVSAMLGASNESWRYLKCHILHLLIDGERWSPTTTHDGSVESGYVLEWIEFKIPYSKFVRMAKAKNVRGKLCNTEFALSDADLAKLRELGDAASIFTDFDAYQRGMRDAEAKKGKH